MIVFSTSTMYHFTLCAYLILFFFVQTKALYLLLSYAHFIAPAVCLAAQITRSTAPPTGRADPRLLGNGRSASLPVSDLFGGEIVSRAFGCSALSYLLSKYKIITIKKLFGKILAKHKIEEVIFRKLYKQLKKIEGQALSVRFGVY